MGRLGSMSLGIALLLFVGVGTAWAGPGGTTPDKDNCVTRLEPTGVVDSNGTVHAKAQLVGCYSTYQQALDVATGVPTAGAPAIRGGSVALGTEWSQHNYNGANNTYSASSGCQSNAWTVDDLGSWNNTFASGKGFGACNSNHKYAGLNESGDSVNCTPNCTNYGTIDNRVSSLKWHN